MQHVPQPTARQLLRRHAASFATALVALTALLLALYARRQVPALSARDASAGTIAEALLLSVPFTAALTIPMAVFVAVLHEFARLRTDGTLAAARRQRRGVRRLVGPVIAAAIGVAALTLASNTVLLPRANERLAALLAGRPASATRSERSDREMTIGELRAAERVARAEARANAAPQALAIAAVYEVEVQKKYALAAACVVLALAGMAVSLRVPHGGRGGAGLVIGASGTVFGAYYALIMTGEALAERLVVSPVVGMWGANALLLGAALLVLSRRRASVEPVGDPTVAIGG